MNQLTDDKIIEIFATEKANSKKEYMLKVARAVIEAAYKRLLADSGEPITVVNGTWGSACVAVIPHDKLYTADHLAAARLQVTEQEREKTEVALGQFRWAAKQMEAGKQRIADLEAQLAEQAMKIATLEGIK